MKLKLLFLSISLLLVPPAYSAVIDGSDDLRGASKEKIEEGSNKDNEAVQEVYQAKKSALINKMVGDDYAGRGNFEKAAEAYIKALPYVRSKLSEEERLQIATYLSWGGKLKEAESELRSIIQENPENHHARTQLARVLLWLNKPDEALAEAENTLKKVYDDKDALLVKADGLSSKGEVDRAIPIYRSLLEREDDFDTRVALCYAYLKIGDVKQAKAFSEQLKPVYSYQKQELDNLKTELEKANEQGRAYSLKAEGDQFAARRQFSAAAENYGELLVFSPRFPTDEWLRMATVMSWGGRHKAAKRELEAILDQEPGNVQARLQLTRVLTWMGEFDAAIKTADAILAGHPEDREAVLAKANAVRLRGFHRDADRLYLALLSQGEGFDERIGLTYSYLTTGYRLKANESLALLNARYPYEEEEFSRLRAVRDWAFDPQIYGGVSFYNDRDDNRVTTYSAGAQFWVRNWKNNLDYRHIYADSPDRTMESDEVQFSTYSRMPWYGGLGGGAGLASGGIVTWKALADFDVFYGSVGLLVTREALNETAELIDNDIRATLFSVSTEQRLTDRITLRGSYGYRDFSDDNTSHDVKAGVAYQFLRKPSLSAGYRFRYLDFDRQTRHGYFDPSNFIANSVFVNLSFETNRWYGFLEPYIGYQTYKRYNDSHDELFGGIGGSLGYRIKQWLAAEVSAEWGNYGGSGVSSGNDSGWYYDQIGFKFIVSL